MSELIKSEESTKQSVELPSLPKTSLPQAQTVALPTTHVTLEPNATSSREVVIVERPGTFRRIGRYHAKLVYGCTTAHFKSDVAYNKLFLGTLIHDYKVLINGHPAIDAMEWLALQNMPVRGTLLQLPGVDERTVERNIRNLRLSVISLAFMWLYVFVGLLDVVTDAVNIESITLFWLTELCVRLTAFLVISLFYFGHGYHSYATHLDRFISGKEYFRALYDLELAAWFPIYTAQKAVNEDG